MALAWLATAVAWRFARPAAIVFWAVIFRLIGLVSQPLLDDDWYRYVWDGWSFVATGNPYALPPSSFFGHPAVPERFLAILDGINHPQLTAIYGPLTETGFLAAYLTSPGELWPWKLVLFSAEALCAVMLWRRSGNWQARKGYTGTLKADQDTARALRFAGESSGALALLLWCPLAIHETAFSAHPDALAVSLAVAGLLAGKGCGGTLKAGKDPAGALRFAGEPFGVSGGLAAGCFFGLAVASKATALILAPLWLAVQIRRGAWPKALRAAGVAAAVVAGAYLPFGDAAVRSLRAMSGFEFNSSAFAVAAHLLGQEAALAACGVATLSLTLLLAWRAGSGFTAQMRAAGLSVAVMLLLSPVVNPWYLLWLLPFVAAAPHPATVTALVAVSLSYCYGIHLGPSAGGGPYDHPAWVRVIEYGAVAVVSLASWVRRGTSGPISLEVDRWRRGWPSIEGKSVAMERQALLPKSVVRG